MKRITNFVELMGERFSSIGVLDVIDVLLLGLIFFLVYRFIRRRRSLPVLIGVGVYALVLQLSGILGFTATYAVLKWLSIPGAVAVLIIFQTDLRAMLEKMGVSVIGIGKLLKYRIVPRSGSREAEALVTGIMRLSASKSGALIVLVRTGGVEDLGQDGIKLDAAISPELICNIFFSPAPLHDGAITIRKKRIDMAGCFLPNYSDPMLNSSFGSRHRAAIGMSRNSDAIVIVISEEDGMISYAENGELTRGIDEQTLKDLMNDYYGVTHKKK